MGLLTEGKALTPEEMRNVGHYIREHGITQFLHTWERVKNVQNDELRFGDEIECGLVVADEEKKTVKISVRSAELRQQLIEKEHQYSHESEGCTWHPEFGGWMIESTPSRPYSKFASDLLRVERNMILRRRRLLSLLKPNEIAPYMTCFPLLGVGDFIDKPKPFAAPYSKSDFIPDYIINPHPRFAALTTNIRSRRGTKVDIQVPLFRDRNTPEFRPEGAEQGPVELPEGYKLEPDTNIHMDAMGFGMGMCCLQVTFQARDMDESRYMYDQLAVLAPIMLAMTAATPIFKGRLSDIDVRWTVIAQSVDDRTPAERGLLTCDQAERTADDRLAGRGIKRIPKSRYDSISTFIYHCKGDSACSRTFAVYNDIPCPIDPVIKMRLRAAGVDENLSHHLAHLFCRDPISAFEGMIELNDNESTDHFESIQSTNWQTCRWKPPPPRHSADEPHIGWRTEFRSMEVSLTDFENAAFSVFVVLFTRVMLAFDLSFYIPLSKVDENMKRAHLRDSVRTQMFHFRKHIAPPCEPCYGSTCTAPILPSACSTHSTSKTDNAANNANSNGSNGDNSHNHSGLPVPPVPSTPSADAKRSSPTSNLSNSAEKESRDDRALSNTEKYIAAAIAAEVAGSPCKALNLSDEDAHEEMTMGEIFNGKGDYFPGLLPLVYAYLDFINCDAITYKRVKEYLQFIEKRATGQLLTPATWMRQFVTSHAAYKQDSVICPEIAHDLLMTCKGIGEGSIHCPELLGDITIDRVRKEDAYGQLLAGRLSGFEKSELLKSLAQRAHNQRPENMPRGLFRAPSIDESRPDNLK